MKKRRINATERDHYTIEELHILIILLYPALEISIANWLILLRSGNPQCTEVLLDVPLKKPQTKPHRNVQSK